MHWKIGRDPYYAELYEILGIEGIKEAGFFFDNALIDYPIEQSLNWLCTPLPQKPLPPNPVVLLCTGAFCPLHQGHIEMMERAKGKVEAMGYQVAAGYMSAGHDEYIFDKNKEQAISIHERLEQIYQAIQPFDWLKIDPWEGLFTKIAVNFTEVLSRLEAYLEKHLGQKIPVFYVCGGDNARFSLSFLKKGHAVVVGRPNYEAAFDTYRKYFENSNRVFFVEGVNSASSSALRQKLSLVAAKPRKLLLRVNEDKKNTTALIKLMKPNFSSIEIVRLSEQQQQYSDLLQSCQVISLDALMPAKFNLQISRAYNLFGFEKMGYVQRPGTKSLDQQLALMPADRSYCLFDDDIQTGKTMEYAVRLLENAGLEIREQWSLNRADPDEEILDARDFFLEGEFAGLVINFQGEHLRLPYIYPYACPRKRASIAQPILFSKQLWALNADYYQQEPKLLSETTKMLQAFFQYLGFGQESTLKDICLWHLEYLETWTTGTKKSSL